MTKEEKKQSKARRKQVKKQRQQEKKFRKSLKVYIARSKYHLTDSPNTLLLSARNKVEAWDVLARMDATVYNHSTYEVQRLRPTSVGLIPGVTKFVKNEVNESTETMGASLQSNPRI